MTLLIFRALAIAGGLWFLAWGIRVCKCTYVESKKRPAGHSFK